MLPLFVYEFFISVCKQTTIFTDQCQEVRSEGAGKETAVLIIENGREEEWCSQARATGEQPERFSALEPSFAEGYAQ
jgi:hypothetical protein